MTNDDPTENFAGNEDLRPVTFGFEGLDARFEGYTDGTRWNGWPVVYVTEATREGIVDAFASDPNAAEEELDAAREDIAWCDERQLYVLEGMTPTLEEG